MSPADVKRASEAGVEAVEAFVQLERKLLEKDLTARHGSAAYKHGQMVTNPSSASKRKQNLLKALHNIATFKHLQQKYHFHFTWTIKI